ncbi:P-loop NTPase family protein [Paenibacillus guangzhouensis]|uniref:AAA family ATPase n=1 Tax=Paenibacillus guangzhouensis TaxID=1473112 RepID=UPI0012677444|nr:AAA family ATPase [Paenibacillus guangzhouensis]
MKIVIIGSSGSGKSTFARELGQIMNLPVHYLDLYYWQAGWVPTPTEEFTALNRRLVAEEAWVIDGLYGKTLDIRLQAADVVFFFDLSPWITTYRVIKRRIQYHGKTRVDMNEGCPESIDWPFIRMGWNFRRDKRPGILAKLEAHAEHTKIIVVKSPREAKRMLHEVKSSGRDYFEREESFRSSF